LKRSSRRHLAARWWESGVGRILKHWLHKKSIVLFDNVRWNSWLSFHQCTATIVWHVYTFSLISRQGAVASRPLHRFSLQMGGASYTVTVYLISSKPVHNFFDWSIVDNSGVARVLMAPVQRHAMGPPVTKQLSNYSFAARTAVTRPVDWLTVAVKSSNDVPTEHKVAKCCNP